MEPPEHPTPFEQRLADDPPVKVAGVVHVPASTTEEALEILAEMYALVLGGLDDDAP